MKSILVGCLRGKTKNKSPWSPSLLLLSCGTKVKVHVSSTIERGVGSILN